MEGSSVLSYDTCAMSFLDPFLQVALLAKLRNTVINISQTAAIIVCLLLDV